MPDMTHDQASLSVASALVGRTLGLVRYLPGGQHASTLLATDGEDHYVVREFPVHDAAPAQELGVLNRLSGLSGLSDLVPRLVAHDVNRDRPVIVSSALAGGPPPADLSLTAIATEMARALVRIHAHDGTGLRPAPGRPPAGESGIAERARREWDGLGRNECVLTHFDFWCGNALWNGGTLTGIVDWSGARCAPRGVDVAWCRQDLVLLGSARAADRFLVEYEKRVGRRLSDMRAWDVQAAAHAETSVESWAPNYQEIGRTELTGNVLRERLDSWVASL
jgi:aminoglycoside phosphotransferase (APT) family kinase protein